MDILSLKKSRKFPTKSSRKASTSRKSRTSKAVRVSKSRKSRKSKTRGVSKSRKSRKSKAVRVSKSRKSRKSKTRGVSKSRKSRKSKAARVSKSRKSRKSKVSKKKYYQPDIVRFAKKSTKCIERSLIPLKPWQEKVVKFMDTNDALLVVHSTGTGKTLTAVTVSQCFLDKDPDNFVVFVGPAGLITNFVKELEKYGVHNPEKYYLYSFDKFLRDEKYISNVLCGKNTLLIIDEAHNLRNVITKIDKITTTESLTRSRAVLNCAMFARKRLLLTATPYVNNIDDFIPLVNILYGERILGTAKQIKAKFAKYRIDEKVLIKYLRNKIDIVTAQDSEFFPEKLIKYVAVPMTDKYFIKYQKALESCYPDEIVDYNDDIVEGENLFFSHPEKFYNGHRRSVNMAGPEYFSSKIEKIIPLIKNKKTVIFTNWLEFGINPIKKTLKLYNIKFEIITGSVDRESRQKIVNSFNNNKFQVLVITKAGSEGLDLHEVRNLIVLDPVWNFAGLEQIMGRVSRYKSHINLPPGKRNVQIFLLASTEPGSEKVKIDFGEKSKSGDRILYDIIHKKKIVSAHLMSLLQTKCAIK